VRSTTGVPSTFYHMSRKCEQRSSRKTSGALWLLLVLLAGYARSNDRAEAIRLSSVVDHGDWGYWGRSGPDHWGSISEDYRTCAVGRAQSPVNINWQNPYYLGKPTIDISPNSSLSFSAAANNFFFKCVKTAHHCGIIDFKNVSYQLESLHFHSPSEHTTGFILRNQYILEAHLVHMSDQGSVLVLAAFFELNRTPNPMLETLLQAAMYKSNVNAVDLRGLHNSSTLLCHVEGSLTTPPCTEGVQWLISSKPVHVASAQVLTFRRLIGGRNRRRPMQALNGRRISCFA
jgi:carbonic anhydrase